MTTTEQILRDALQDEHDWLRGQRKAISKGCGSSWDIGQCDERMVLIDIALSATGAAEAPGTVTAESAEKMGRYGVEHSESKRETFEAYMRGHNWAVAPFDFDRLCYGDIQTRMLFAVWRDCSALYTHPDPSQSDNHQVRDAAVRYAALKEAADLMLGYGPSGLLNRFANDILNLRSQPAQSRLFSEAEL